MVLYIFTLCVKVDFLSFLYIKYFKSMRCKDKVYGYFVNVFFSCLFLIHRENGDMVN